MKQLLSNHTFFLVAGGFVLLAALVYSQGRDAAPEWTSVEEAVAPAAAPSAAPSAENVDPGFHARLMALRTRLDAAPEDTTLLLEAARLEQDAHQLDAAAEHYERFLALAPHTRQVWLDLANVYAGLGQWSDARRASERLLEHVPDDPSALYNLGAIAANRGERDEARRWWTRVRDGSDASLAAQAETSLAQLDAMGTAASDPAPRPASASRSNPHARLGQPVVARPVRALAAQE